MNAADLARLELAKRAYKAAEPRDAEVQTGVRRARLWLGRPKPRRAWFSRGLVLVVLAIGSLAYAKPQASVELVEKVLGRDDAAGRKRLQPGVTVQAPVAAAAHAAAAKGLDVFPPSRSERAGALEAAGVTAPFAALAAGPGPAAPTAARAVTPTRGSAPPSPPARPTALAPAKGAGVGQTPPNGAVAANGAVTDWGRVGQALAHGDSAGALSALGELSESDDPSTRDKADLGRAQLLMAHGEPEAACALARSLTHRRAGGRIERQAQLLLKSCAR